MAKNNITITPETKIDITITNEDKPSNQTFDDMPVSFDSVSTPFKQAGTAITLETKKNITITNE